MIRSTTPASRRFLSRRCIGSSSSFNSISLCALQLQPRQKIVQVHGCSTMPSASAVAVVRSLHEPNHYRRSHRTFLSSTVNSSIILPSVSTPHYPGNLQNNNAWLRRNSSAAMCGLGLGSTRWLSSNSFKHSPPNARISTLESFLRDKNKLTHSPIIRHFASNSKKAKGTSSEPNNKFADYSTMKTLKELHNYVKTHLSMDIWTINILLLAFIIGPAVWNSMKNSTHTDDDIPVDDPVEHSVKILMDSIRNTNQPGETQSSSSSSSSFNVNKKVSITSPEEDAKRILTDLLASENIRTTASRIASSVIQSPPFQNACVVLVKNIWSDLANDPETTAQLTTLVTTVLQNEKMYAAVKALVLQLVNDEEVYRELTKLVVKVGGEQEVLDATQKLLTESAHKTLNDPNVLDHSMEFATEVVGDDVVQRTGGEALRNTVGYAVQPSGSVVLTGIGTGIVAGVLYFYLSRRGGDGGGGGQQSSTFAEDWNYRGNSVVSSQPRIPKQFLDASPSSSATNSYDVGRDTFGGGSPSNGSLSANALVLTATDVALKIVHFPSVLVGSIRGVVSTAIAFPAHTSEKCLEGWEWLQHAKPVELAREIVRFPSVIVRSIRASISTVVAFPASMSEKCIAAWDWIRCKFANGALVVCNLPSRLATSTVAMASSTSLWISDKSSIIFYSCRSRIAMLFHTVADVPKYGRDVRNYLVFMVAEYVGQMRGGGGISPTTTI